MVNNISATCYGDRWLPGLTTLAISQRMQMSDHYGGHLKHGLSTIFQFYLKVHNLLTLFNHV